MTRPMTFAMFAFPAIMSATLATVDHGWSKWWVAYGVGLAYALGYIVKALEAAAEER